MTSSVRSLGLAGSAGFLLSLLSALPVQAHGPAGDHVTAGVLHPLTGLDHLLLLVGVGALAARLDRRLLLPAVLGAVVGALFGAWGGAMPAGELLAALSVSALGLLLLLALRLQGAGVPLALAGTVVGVAVAIHALLHGQAAEGVPAWWLGATLSAIGVVTGSGLVLRRASPQALRLLALVLSFGGLALALVPLA